MAISFIGHAEAGSGDQFGTSLASAARAITTGNANIIGIRHTDVSTVTGVTDTAGNTYTVLTRYGGVVTIAYALNITGHAANVVTASFSTTDWFRAISADEFSGVATSSALDDEDGGATSGTTLTSPAFTTTNANDVVYVCGSVAAGGSTFTAGSGYTLIDGSIGGAGFTYFGSEYKVVSAVISGVAQTIVGNESANGGIAVAAFKEAVVAAASNRTMGLLGVGT